MLFKRQYLLALLTVAATVAVSCFALVAQADEAMKVTTTNIAPATGVDATATSTSAKGSPAPVVATEPPAVAAGPVATGAPATGATAVPQGASELAKGATAALDFAAGQATTTKPATGALAPPSPPPPASPLSPSPATAIAPTPTAGVDEKLEQYFEPVCVAVTGNKLLPKQLFKLQSQLKQFVERTSGKMSLCFMSHYSIDPNLTPVTKDQLAAICSSKSLGPDVKGSFKQFKECSARNWDPNLDKEVDRIIEARVNFTRNHKQESAQTIGHSHEQDDDELTMIGDVVKKVLDGNKEALDKPGIKVIDVSGPAAAAAVANKQAGDKAGSTPAPLASLLMPNKKLLNDPNTVVVFVDEPASKGSSTAPPSGLPARVEPSTSSKPAALAEVKAGPAVASTSVANDKPSDGAASNKVAEEAKVNLPANSAQVTADLAEAKTTASPSVPAQPNSSSTGAPSTTKPPAGAPSSKPLENLKDMLKRQEREKSELEAKLKAEREKILRQLQKKQDELDARNAIKSLQLQRATGGHSGSHADAKLHQIEHERQMSIDPIGHTIKHQQYELSKQRKMASSFSILSG